MISRTFIGALAVTSVASIGASFQLGYKPKNEFEKEFAKVCFYGGLGLLGLTYILNQQRMKKEEEVPFFQSDDINTIE